MKNQTTQQPKINSKLWPIASLVSGIITIMASLIWFLPGPIMRFFLGNSWQLSFYFWIFIPLSILGLILGIIGLKSTENKMAILGIIFSIIALLILLSFFFIGLAFSES